MRAWADAAFQILRGWSGWGTIWPESETTLFMLELEAEQLYALTCASGRDPETLEAAPSNLAIMAVHWWATEGRRLDLRNRR